MFKAGQIVRLLLLFFIISLFIGSGCATSKKSSGYTQKKQASRVNASQLGRNKYYFSTNYQKKLSKSYKKK
jgi:hypothetical protein